MNYPISIIIPVFNSSMHITNLFNNLQRQTYNNFEVIIVNDGSTDDTLELINNNNFKNKKVISINNSGPSKARNTGIKEAKHNYICFLDSDDYWTKDHLHLINMLININPSCSIFCSSYVKSKSQIALNNNLDDFKYEYLNINNYLEKKINNELVIWTSACCINKSYTEEHIFNEDYKHGEDQALWLRLISCESALKHNLNTAVYIDNPNSLSKNSIFQKDAIINELDIMLESKKFKSLTSHLVIMKNKYIISHLKNNILNGMYSNHFLLNNYNFKTINFRHHCEYTICLMISRLKLFQNLLKIYQKMKN